ncbi:YetF domain-containing protein [Wukongibacter sp. M2B1]|uniref:YetF domain-containing protein n=1 Tax=Wukongibacter sp. M2B1 TaxID=3088895 RepID=UPI003D7BE8FB
MITIFIRTMILYILVVAAIRLMGKAELSELQPYELVIIIMISELASLPMATVEMPFVNGVVAISTLVFLQIVISFITLKSEKARAIICGKPSILIENGKILENELKELRININDLIEQLRIKDFANIDDVEFAILETNGDLSVIPKSSKRPLTPSDMNISITQEDLPISLIIDGKINQQNLNRASIDFNWLNTELKKKGINDISKILYASIDNSNNLSIHLKNAKKEKKK